MQPALDPLWSGTPAGLLARHIRSCDLDWLTRSARALVAQQFSPQRIFLITQVLYGRVCSCTYLGRTVPYQVRFCTSTAPVSLAPSHFQECPSSHELYNSVYTAALARGALCRVAEHGLDGVF